MKKFLHLFLMLFVGVGTVAFAQQEEASSVETWEGDNLRLEMSPGDKLTFEYTATADGTLYIYSDDQAVEENVPIDIWGGWYNNGAYESDSPLQDAGYYDNGVGVYGWLRVMDGDVVRFTLTASEDADGQLTEFTLKSMFFNDNYGGDSWETPVILKKDVNVNVPVCPNGSSDFLIGIDANNATFCKFTAPSDGVASLYTDAYVVYYLEEENIGSLEHLFKAVSQDVKTDDHEFWVEGGVDYLVVVPNARPTTLKFKMNYDRLGLSPKFPVEITEFPATIDVMKGNNYYAFSHEVIGNLKMLEVDVASGWTGTITYMENPSEASDELVTNQVDGQAATFVKNVDPRFLAGESVIMNFKKSESGSLASAATLNLREPIGGETFDTAIQANKGENTISKPAGDYWFAYTAETDGEYSFEAESGTIKHVNYTVAAEVLNADNVYRINAGQTIYVCITTTTTNSIFTISGKDIREGDYRDMPIYFELGDKMAIEGREVDSYHSFTAKEDGFAIFESTNYSVSFYKGDETSPTYPLMTKEEDKDNTYYTYKLPIAKGQTYVVVVQTVMMDLTITTAFEAPAAMGDLCSNAIEISTLDEKVNVAYAFDVAKWYRFTADEDGFYTVKAKLGNKGSMKTKVGDCDAVEKNASSDDSASDMAYMGGYRTARVYLVEGQTLYIYTETGSKNTGKDDNGQEIDLYERDFGTDLYLLVSYEGEARPGEDVAVAVQAAANKEYTVLKNDADGYEQWYTYTIPAGEVAVIWLEYVPRTKYTSNNITLLNEDMTSMSRWNDDFVQEDLTNEAGEVYGKSLEIPSVEQPRKIYIKLTTVYAKFYSEPVVWQIICNDNTDDNTGVDVESIADEEPVIYDLMGRRVENPIRGIYIVNGVKRVIK